MINYWLMIQRNIKTFKGSEQRGDTFNTSLNVLDVLMIQTRCFASLKVNKLKVIFPVSDLNRTSVSSLLQSSWMIRVRCSSASSLVSIFLQLTWRRRTPTTERLFSFTLRVLGASRRRLYTKVPPGSCDSTALLFVCKSFKVTEKIQRKWRLTETEWRDDDDDDDHDVCQDFKTI